jgi:hypothetical protein
MRIPAFPIIVSFALLAAPAFAQNSSTGTTPEQSGVSASSNTDRHGSSVTPDARQKLIQSLDQSGFKNVRVTAESFIIHAQAPDGSNIVMLLGPDEMTGMIQPSGSSSEPSSPTQSGSPSSESGTTH